MTGIQGARVSSSRTAARWQVALGDGPGPHLIDRYEVRSTGYERLSENGLAWHVTHDTAHYFYCCNLIGLVSSCCYMIKRNLTVGPWKPKFSGRVEASSIAVCKHQRTT
jgi:hypothetical protein